MTSSPAPSSASNAKGPRAAAACMAVLVLLLVLQLTSSASVSSLRAESQLAANEKKSSTTMMRMRTLKLRNEKKNEFKLMEYNILAEIFADNTRPYFFFDSQLPDSQRKAFYQQFNANKFDFAVRRRIAGLLLWF